jgi:amino acid adenylation domain-containing protein
MIGQIFKNNLNKFFEKTALKYGNENLSYRELDYQTDKLAIFLSNQNIKFGSIVGIKINNPVLYVKCIIALVKIGAVYVPFDSLQPLPRIEKMCSEANVSFILYDKFNSIKIYSEAQDIQITDDYISLTKFESFRLHESTNADSPLYIMFTSGSTGGPKGVIIPNRGVMRLVCESNYIKINSNDVILQLSSLSFDASTFEIWGSLLNGAALYLIDRTFDLENISFVLKEHKISVLFLTTRLFDKLVDYDVQMFSGIRVLLFGGEAHSFSHVHKVFDMLPDTKLLHCYGPTENTTFTLIQKVSHWNIKDGYIPIGKEISETQCYVLDENLNIRNDNEPGILFIGGKGLALGYTDKKLTEQKFIFHPALNERLYNTGDKVIRHTGGVYEYIGRIDRQVKIRGYRVELFEIEIELKKNNSISQAVVVFNQLFINNHYYPTNQ